jgi:O-antigen ligase
MAWALIAVIAIFALAAGTKRTISIGVLLVLIPFQQIDTPYASSSVLIAYVLAAVLLIQGGLRVRMLPSIGLIVLAYFTSFAIADQPGMRLWHMTFMFQFFSCFVVFLLAYNFALLVENGRSIFDVLLAANVLSILYCAVQLWMGPGVSFVPFGIEELAFNKNRHAGDPRLVGPFDNPGTTGGYFSLMVLICAVDLVFARGWRRWLLWAVVAGNLFGLVATGNRASFLVLLAMFPAMLFVFRRQLGAKRVVLYSLGGASVLAVAASVAVAVSGFGQMFMRLETVTEMEGGIPATRQQGWPVALEKIRQNPWFGEGPYFWTAEDAERTGELRVEFEELGELSTAFDPYPHSLYLYQLRTVGVFGLVALLAFFLRAWGILYFSTRRESRGDYRSAFVRLGLLLIPAFLVAQITLEFNRPHTMDYAQFIFALVGLLIGSSDRKLQLAAAANTIAPNPVALLNRGSHRRPAS